MSCLSVCFFTASAFQADWRRLDGNKVSKVGVLDELPVTTTHMGLSENRVYSQL